MYLMQLSILQTTKLAAMVRFSCFERSLDDARLLFVLFNQSLVQDHLRLDSISQASLACK